jgi:hypothetical protein
VTLAPFLKKRNNSAAIGVTKTQKLREITAENDDGRLPTRWDFKGRRCAMIGPIERAESSDQHSSDNAAASLVGGVR